ncbi:MAG: hypothetical protein A2503_10240 [Burkholderiales bacterium RIFOXYD12_FULL_59_19]|nr:MAG: hypothetical protein A2503_10240 [Burkholderiales bacterium RIFOXYD12_FULL_59_19]
MVFGGEGTFVAPNTIASMAATLPNLQGGIGLAVGVPASIIAAPLPGPTMAGTAAYSSDTQRPIISQTLAIGQIAKPTEFGNTQPYQRAQPMQAGVQHQATDAVYAHTGTIPTFATAQPASTQTGGQFDDATGARAQAAAHWQEGNPAARLAVNGLFEYGVRASAQLYGRFQDGHHDRRPSRTTGWADGATRRKGYTGQSGQGKATPFGRSSRYQNAWPPRAGQYTAPATPPTPAPYWGTVLVFACPPLAAPHLVFGVYQCPGIDPTVPAFFQILPARFYMTAHTIYAQTLPGLADVPIFDATVAADSGSFCWSLSATGPASLFEQLAPVGGLPVQIKLTLDGIPWVFAVDSLARQNAFGQSRVRVQGRSVTAMIAAPYMRSTSRIEANERTAQQLAEADLTGTGITLDWGIGAGALANGGLVDWLVPAGAYSRQGTPLEAVQRIAAAVGGYLQSHRSAPTLLARHPYGQRVGDVSGAPWDWSSGAADVELAPDALITESVSRADGPDINAVYVSGTSHGVLALVRRTGTAADKLADMRTDSLITHADAARQAGLAILGAAGHKYNVQLDLPVLTGTGHPGVLDVGQLVQVNTTQPWRARVRAVSVQAKQPTLRQTITLERHLEPTA